MQEFGPNGPKSGAKWGLCHFREFGSWVLEFAIFPWDWIIITILTEIFIIYTTKSGILFLFHQCLEIWFVEWKFILFKNLFIISVFTDGTVLWVLLSKSWFFLNSKGFHKINESTVPLLKDFCVRVIIYLDNLQFMKVSRQKTALSTVHFKIHIRPIRFSHQYKEITLDTKIDFRAFWVEIISQVSMSLPNERVENVKSQCSDFWHIGQVYIQVILHVAYKINRIKKWSPRYHKVEYRVF